MGVPALPVSTTDLAILRARAASDVISPNGGLRARIILMAAEGVGVAEIAVHLGCSERTATRWIERYRASGVVGLRDAPRPGRPVRVREIDIIERTLAAPPGDRRRWSSRLLAADLGISNVSVANVWRTWGVRPLGAAGYVQLATDPVFEGSVQAVVGLHLTPGARALAVLTPPPSGATAAVRQTVVEHDGDERRNPSAAGFLRAAARAAAAAGPGGSLCLVADGGAVPALDSVDPRVPVHAVLPGHSWSRIATIVVASATPGTNADRLAVLREKLEAADQEACRELLSTL